MYGTWCRYLFNILQAIQLICNVGAIIISNGEALSEAAKFKLCYAICCLVWALAGFVLGQIRTLQKFTWLANVAVFLNLTIMFITMGAAAHTDPLYSASASSAGYSIDPALVTPVNGTYPPVQHSGGLPSSNFAASLNGAMQAVYSYGGSMIFPEFMAEIRRPRDFLKGMWSAQLFIYVCYMLYGLFMYGYQGQYVQTPAYLGISAYGLQTAGNSLAIVSALIAATLYGNIGIKGRTLSKQSRGKAESMLTQSPSPVQQRACRVLQGASSGKQTGQIHLVCPCANLLVRRLRNRRIDSRFCWIHRHRRCCLYLTVHVFVPTASAFRLPNSEVRHGRGNRVRRQHW